MAVAVVVVVVVMSRVRLLTNLLAAHSPIPHELLLLPTVGMRIMNELYCACTNCQYTHLGFSNPDLSSDTSTSHDPSQKPLLSDPFCACLQDAKNFPLTEELSASRLQVQVGLVSRVWVVR